MLNHKTINKNSAIYLYYFQIEICNAPYLLITTTNKQQLYNACMLLQTK